MRKLAVLAVAVALLLCGCTEQSTLNPSLFVERFAKSYSEFNVDTESIFYEENKCVVFIENASGRRFAMEMTADPSDRVQKISLACIETDKAYEFYYLAECVAENYAPQEDFSAAAKVIFSGKKYSYYETQWYYYCFSENESGLYFCIEDKHFAPQKDEHLTLKENDIVTGVH